MNSTQKHISRRKRKNHVPGATAHKIVSVEVGDAAMTPTGSRPPAQGCRASREATLGHPSATPNPDGVAPPVEVGDAALLAMAALAAPIDQQTLFACQKWHLARAHSFRRESDKLNAELLQKMGPGVPSADRDQIRKEIRNLLRAASLHWRFVHALTPLVKQPLGKP